MQAVKMSSVGADLIEGIGMPFGGPFPGGLDVHNEKFGPSTEFSLDWFKERPLLFDHGLEKGVGTSVVGRVLKWRQTDLGIWVQCQLDRNSKFFAAITELIKKGALYFSSGSMGHLVETDKRSGLITKWPWIELSLTPSPANPYARLDFATAEKHLKAAGLAMPTRAASTVKRLGYVIVSPDDEEVGMYRRFLVRTVGARCQEHLDVKGNVEYFFVRRAEDLEVPDVYAPGETTWAFTPDKPRSDGSHAVYIRSDIEDFHTKECVAHEVCHIKQIQDGRVGVEPMSALEAEADAFGYRIEHDLFGANWTAYQLGQHDLSRG